MSDDGKKTELQYARDTIASMLASIREGVIITDGTGTILAANPVTELLTGILPTELIGKGIEEMMTFACDNDDVSDFFEESLRGWRALELPKNCSITPKGGKARIPVAANATPLFNPEGAYTGVVFVLRDLTEEVNARNRQYQFLSFVSHQLRAPIASLRLGLEMLLDKKERLVPETHEILRDLYDITTRFSGLIKELLNITRLAEGRVEFRQDSIDIRDLGPFLTQEFERLATSNNITFSSFADSETPLMMVGDKERMLDVLRNLVANAIFYNKPRGEVVIRGRLTHSKEVETIAARTGAGLQIGEYLRHFSSTEKEKNMILIEVADTGLGIPASDQPRIFESFFRARNVVKRGIHGTGLGLSIVKSIVEHLNGRIMFESKEDKGTTFYIIFPSIT
jgi:PAS domain S-box-containing protein